jgi:hypothetical protein
MKEIEQALGLKGAISIIEINGAWIAGDAKSRTMLKKCGLNPAGRFLNYDLLLSHVSKFGYCLETDAQ